MASLNGLDITTARRHMVCFAICRKDSRLPEQLQRAMAAEAEAAREARAKVRSSGPISARERTFSTVVCSSFNGMVADSKLSFFSFS